MATPAQTPLDTGSDEGRPGGGFPRRRVVIGALVVVLLAAIGTWLVAFSAVFGVGTVKVQGTHVLTVAEVQKAADVSDGAPLIRLDTAAITRRVEKLPDVASARVDVHYPSTVTITVIERVPVGYVETGAGSAAAYRLVDRTGAEYRTVGQRPPLPLLVLPSGPSDSTAGAAAEVAADLPRSLLRRIASVQALDPNAITLVLRDHRVVAWGSVARSAAKARILPALLTQKGTQYDVSNPDQPFLRQ
jgi:cell division protein FtsQ